MKKLKDFFKEKMDSEGGIKLRNHLKNAQQEFWAGISGKHQDGTAFPPIKRATRFGLLVLFIFFGLFGLWSITFPLESAAIANGKVIVASNRKTIQHLEGGIIRDIYVKEGSVVKAGDPLIRLDDTQAKATYDLLFNQANDLLTTEARLKAERDGAKSIVFPDRLLKSTDPEIKKLMQAQEQIFSNNRETLNGQYQILNQRIGQLNEQVNGLKAQVKSNDTQLDFIKKELDAYKTLEEKHYIEKPKIWALERESARLSGNRGETLGQIAEAEQKIGETQQQIITLKDSTEKDTLQKLTEIQSKLSDVLQKEKAAEDVLRRTLITAPQAGTVIGLQEHTIGGVISPGKPVMDIVPTLDQMLVEAKVNPLDIDDVHIGLPAKVQLTAYKQRSMPWIEGTVTEVSPDIFQDQQSHESYYTARVVVSAKDLAKLKNVKLYPGMPVSVMIVTDKRTAFSYLITPLTDSFNRAFREK